MTMDPKDIDMWVELVPGLSIICGSTGFGLTPHSYEDIEKMRRAVPKVPKDLPPDWWKDES